MLKLHDFCNRALDQITQVVVWLVPGKAQPAACAIRIDHPFRLLPYQSTLRDVAFIQDAVLAVEIVQAANSIRRPLRRKT